MALTALNIKFVYDESRVDQFLRGEQDILFARESELRRYSNIRQTALFDSHFYIVLCQDDPLAKREILNRSDLFGRTFMVSGVSPSELIVVQNRIVAMGQVKVLNCPDHESALSNIAAKKGVVLSPGFANEHNGEFVWVPLDCPEHIKCVFGYHRDDVRESTRFFMELAQAAYTHADAISA